MNSIIYVFKVLSWPARQIENKKSAAVSSRANSVSEMPEPIADSHQRRQAEQASEGQAKLGRGSHPRSRSASFRTDLAFAGASHTSRQHLEPIRAEAGSNSVRLRRYARFDIAREALGLPKVGVRDIGFLQADERADIAIHAEALGQRIDIVDNLIHDGAPSDIFRIERLLRIRAMDPAELGVARESISAVNSIDGEGGVDERDAAQQTHAFVEIGVAVKSQIHARTVAEEQCQRIFPEAISRGRRINPILPSMRVDEMNTGFDIAQRRSFEWPEVGGKVDGAQALLAHSTSRRDVVAEGAPRRSDDAAIRGLQHIRRGEADRRPQRKMNEDVRFDECRKQHVVGVEKDDVFTGARGEAGPEGGGLPQIFFMADYFDLRCPASNRFEHDVAVIVRRIIDDDAFDTRISLSEY
ncbi:MAG TPA: hypothetical protein VIF40_20805 [Methylosinus sp.]